MHIVFGVALVLIFGWWFIGEDIADKFTEHREKLAKIRRDEERDRLERVRLEAKHEARAPGVNLDK